MASIISPTRTQTEHQWVDEKGVLFRVTNLQGTFACIKYIQGWRSEQDMPLICKVQLMVRGILFSEYSCARELVNWRFVCYGGIRPLNLLSTSFGEAIPVGGKKQKLDSR